MKIKFCGITSLSDALAAIEAGADLLGFNFYPKSPRYIEPEACQKITSVLRKDFPHITLVGVFVNASISEIRSIIDTCQLHLAQLHGDETPEMLAELGGQAFKAIRLPSSAKEHGSTSSSVLASVSPFLSAASFAYPLQKSAPASASPLPSAAPSDYPLQKSAPASVTRPALLVDAAVKGLYGGSGVVADWSAAAELAKRIRLLLAGGLTPDNVAEAVRRVQPWGVDVASGVEVPPQSGGKSSPGVKDTEKMNNFVKAVRAAESTSAESISILPAEMGDLEQILALQKLAYQSEAELNNDFSIPPLTQTLAEIRAEFGQAVFLKAVQADKIIGSVRGRLDGDTCHIGRVIVHPECQNRGIGSRLLREIEHRVNARRFELFTGQRSEHNLYLYRKFGYRDFKQVPLNERITLIFLEKFNDQTTA
jgi:phosphoribosylanthranilate isomerase